MFKNYRIPSLFVFQHVTNNGLGSVYKDRGNSFLHHKTLIKLKRKKDLIREKYKQSLTLWNPGKIPT